MSDTPRDPGDDASDWLASQFDETGSHEPVVPADETSKPADEAQDPQPATPASAPSVSPAEPPAGSTTPGSSGETAPIVPRRLPSAETFFGEPRPPRHSARVAPPASVPSAPESAEVPAQPTPQPASEPPAAEQPAAEQPAAEQPAVAEPATSAAEPVAEPTTPAFQPEPAPVVERAPVAEPAAAPETAPVPAAPAAPPEAVAEPPAAVESDSVAEPSAAAPAPQAAPAPPEPTPRPASTPVAHPQALDLSALQGGEDLVAPVSGADEAPHDAPTPWHLGEDTAGFDPRSLPAHDEPGETPTAAFGAVFGSAPTAPVRKQPAPDELFVSGDGPRPDDRPEAPDAIPAADRAASAGPSTPAAAPAPTSAPSDLSFTELIAMPGDVAPSAESMSFDWNDLPEPRTSEISLPHGNVETESPVFTPDPPILDSTPARSAATAEDAAIVEDRATVADAATAEESATAEEAVPAAEPYEPPIVEPWVDEAALEPLPATPQEDPRPAGEPTPTEVEDATDPVAALLGFDVDSEDAGDLAAETTAIPAAVDGDTAGDDGSWADEPRPPIPPALGAKAAADDAVGSAEQSRPEESQPQPEKPGPEQLQPVEPQPEQLEPEQLQPEQPEQQDDAAPSGGVPTEAFTWADEPSGDVPTAVYVPQHGAPAPTAEAGQTEPATEILRSERHEAAPVDHRSPVDAPAAARDGVDSNGVDSSGGTRGGGFASWTQRQKLLLAIAIGVAFVLVLVALYFAGKALLGHASQPAAAPAATAVRTPSNRPTPSTTPSSTPTPTVAPASGPAVPGTHSWKDLQGGECLATFTNAFQQTYQVVDCATAHPAQMVAKGTVTGTTYPGLSALAAQVGPLCQAGSVINLGAAAAYTDIQVSSSYPATQAQWDAGDHNYYCFVSRSSGGTITGSLKQGA